MTLTNKGIISRKCLIDKQSHLASEMVRIALINKKDVIIDIDQILGGRGCYIHKNISSEDLKQFVRQRGLNRAFKMNVNQEIYNQLVKILQKEE